MKETKAFIRRNMPDEVVMDLRKAGFISVLCQKWKEMNRKGKSIQNWLFYHTG